MNVKEITKQLEAASVELPGLPGRWVRAADALKILGMHPKSHRMLSAKGRTESLVRVRVGGFRPKVRFVSLNDCIARYTTRSEWAKRLWTADEDAQIRGLYGRVPVEQIAANLKRTVRGVYHRANAIGIDVDGLVLRRDNVLTTRMLADLCGVSVRRVHWWFVRGGLPHKRLASGQRLAVVDLREFRAWMLKNPRIFRQVPAVLADRLKLDIADSRYGRPGVVLDLKKQESAA